MKEQLQRLIEIYKSRIKGMKGTRMSKHYISNFQIIIDDLQEIVDSDLSLCCSQCGEQTDGTRSYLQNGEVFYSCEFHYNR